MKLKLFVLIMTFVSISIYSLEINIIEITYNREKIVIDLEVSSEGMVFIPENALENEISRYIGPFGIDYQIFNAFLVKSDLRIDRYILIVSNENIGITKYFNRIHSTWLLTGVKFIPFVGKRRLKIVLEHIGSLYPVNNNKEYMIDEISFSYCYSTNIKLNNRSSDELILQETDFWENFLKIASISYRLVNPIVYLFHTEL